MTARSTRGPGGGRTGGRRPATRKGGGRGAASSGCLLALIVGVLVVGTALILTPLATRVWTMAYIPAANRVHFGDGLVVALALAGLVLYLLVSVLLVPRRTTAAAGPRGTAADGPGVPNSARPAPRPVEGRATGRGVTPGGTP